MMAWGTGAQLAERPDPACAPAAAEAACREALIESFDGLELADRNLLRFRYFHRLTVEQLAEMFCIRRAALVRQLARIRERLLRETRRGLAARLPADRRELDRLIGVVRDRFELAVARILRR